MTRVSASETPAVILPTVAREVEEFVAAGGWEQPPQLFALVATSNLIDQQPELRSQLDPESSPLTPIAQDALDGDLADALAGIEWPPAVTGCALAQEIVVLPPEAETELSHGDLDDEAARQFAAAHPARREARLVAVVLRDGSVSCLLRLRGTVEVPEEAVEHPELAPNLTDALLATLRP